MATDLSAHRVGSEAASALRLALEVVEEFIEASAAATALPELAALYKLAIAQLDCNYFAFVQLGARPAAGNPSVDGVPTVALDYPEPWVRQYLAQDYFAVDPVVRAARTAATPYAWSSLSDLTPRERQFLDESESAGLRHGLAIPIHEPQGRVFLACVATSQSSWNAKRLEPVLHMLAAQFHVRFCELGRSLGAETSVRLTSRERECLLWTARGKSSWSISRLIGISEHTVNFHVKNAMGKLGTASRVSAVAKCVRLGLIVP
jgi:LuxR family transcriptional regulator, quorum-sensing system regulator CciR